jgi:hypothetical protein
MKSKPQSSTEYGERMLFIEDAIGLKGLFDV